MRPVSSSKLKVLFLLPVLVLLFSFADGIKEVPSVPVSKDFIEESDFSSLDVETSDTDEGESDNTFYIDGTLVNPTVEVPCETGIADFAAPTVTNLYMTGTMEHRFSLTINYTYNDPDGDPESGTTFQWYTYDDQFGTNKQPIAGATTQTITVWGTTYGYADQYLVGKHISCEVTPRDNTASVGITVEEMPWDASNSNPVIAQGNNCNNASGSGAPAPANDLTPNINVCSPRAVSWEVSYTGINYDFFRSPVIYIDWGDGSVESFAPTLANTNPPTTLAERIALVNQSLQKWEITAPHTYDYDGGSAPPADGSCTYELTTYFGAGVLVCRNADQTQDLAVWDDIGNTDLGTHNTDWDPTSAGVEIGETVEVCEGDNSAVRLVDASTFNCTANEPQSANQNQQSRWVQWVYGSSSNVTTGAAADEKIIIKGVSYDASDLPIYGTPTVQPPNVTAPNAKTDDIQMPTSALVGEVFEVTMRSWNTCNPFNSLADDVNPTQAVPALQVFEFNTKSAGVVGTEQAGLNAITSGNVYYAHDVPITRTYDIVISTKPADPTTTPQTVCNGSALPNFTISAAGNLSVNWYEDNAGAPGASITNSLGANSLQLPASDYEPGGGITSTAAGVYTVWAEYVANTGSQNCVSDPISVNLTITEALAGTGAISGSTNVCNNGTYAYTIPAAAGTQPLGGDEEYVWSAVGGNVTITPSVTTTNNVSVDFNLPAGFGSTTRTLQVLRRYQNAPQCPTSNSTLVVTVYEETAGGSVSGTTSICEGSSTGNLTLSGHIGTVLDWERRLVPGGFASIGNAGMTTITDTPPTTGTYEYRAVIQNNAACSSENSAVATITVNPVPSKPTITPSGPTTFCEDASVTLTAVSANANSFQWYKGGVAIGGATSNTLVLSNDSDDGSYTVEGIGIAPTLCTSPVSNPTSVTVNPLPTASVTGGGSVCSGNPAPDMVWTLTGTAPYNFTITRPAGEGAALVVVGHPTNTYTYSGATSGGNYEMTVLQDANSCNGTSLGGPATVTIGGTTPTLSNFTVDAPVCENNGSLTIPFWHVDVDVTGDYDIDYTINGTPQTTISTGNLNAGDTYDYQVTYAQLGSTPGTYTIALTSAVNTASGCVAALPGNTVDIVINPDPADPSNPVDAIACSSDATGATLAVDDPGAGFTVEWYSNMALTISAVGVTSGSNEEQFTPTSTATATYYAIITDDATSCPSVNFVTVQHTQDLLPTAASAGPNFNTCSDTDNLVAVAADNGGMGTWKVQDVLYFDNFDSPTDDGLGAVGPVPTITEPTNGSWTVGGNLTGMDASDYFKIGNSRFEARDVDNEVAWFSEVIDISGYPGGVDASVDLSNNGFPGNVLEGSDYVHVFYKLNGGAETPFTNNDSQSNDFAPVTATELGISGSTFQIVIRVINNANTEEIYFDNVVVKSSAVASYPLVADIHDENSSVSNLQIGANVFTWEVNSALNVCSPSTASLTITRNSLPDAFDSTPSVCEDVYGGNSYNIPDLTIYDDDVTGIATSANRTIEYFDDVARMPGNLINPPTNHLITSALNIVYTRVTRTDVTPNCTQDGTLTFTIVSRPDAVDQDAGVNAAETEFCEDFPVGSGVKTGIDLTDLDNDVSNNLANRTVAWFTDAAYSVPVPNATNASANDGELFYARVTETSSLQSCTNDAVVTITVNSRPADNPILGADTQCVGGPTSLYQINPGPAGTTYNWNIPAQFTVFGGGTVNDFFVLLQFPTATVQTLEVTEISPDNCDGNVQQLVITVQASPPISAITGPAAVCANESGVVYSVTNTANTDYAWTVPTGASIIFGQGTSSITVNFGATGGNVEVIPSTQGGGCTGGTATQAVTVNQRPILDPNLDATICSDDDISITLAADGGSPVAAASYNVTATVAPGLVANVGPTTGNGVTSAAIFNDNFTNKTGGPLDVTYTVTPVSADNCVGSSVNVIATIDPEPVMATGLDVTECSDVAIGLTLNTAGGSVVAANYNITGVVIPGGLTAGANAVVPQTGVADNYLVNDTYTNTGNSPLVVQYTAVAVSADGCPGDALVINATINPEPVISTLLDKTVCSDNTIALTFATNGVSVAASTYNLVNVSIPGGLTAGGSNAAFPSNGVASNFVVSDTYTNQTTLPIDVTYQVQGVSADACTGDSQFIVVTIDPEPVMNGSLSTTVCSDAASGITLASVGTAVAANDYNLVNVTIPAGATAAGSNAVFPANNQADNYIASDSYTNQTAAAVDVIYEVQGVSAASCVGDSEFITLTVDPEPVINPALDATVCSDDAIGITLNTNGSSVAAASYDVLTITPDPGLVAGGGNVMVANGVAANYISGDTYTNTTNASLTATYEVRGTAGGTGCKGDSEFIVVTINPEPVISPSLNTTVCSDVSIGVTLTNNGTSIAAANYNIVSVTIPAGLAAGGGNVAIPASGVASGYIFTDTYTNQTSGALVVEYDVEGVSGAGCTGDVETIFVAINPEPVIDPGLDNTVCSDVATGLMLNTNGTSVVAANYNIVAVTIPAGLTAGANAVVPANGVGTGYLAGDTYTNQTNASIIVIYEVKGVSASACIGDSEFIDITIDPEPVVDNTLGATVCSNDVIGLNLATDASSVPATSYNVVSVGIAAGLTAGGGNAAIPGNSVALGYLAADTYYNPTNSSLNVTYDVQGNSAAGCTGDIETITVVIEPEPVISTTLGKTVCSDDNINITLATNGTSVAAANYNVKSITIPVGITATGTNAVIPASGVAAGYIFGDSYTNKTAASLNVIYEVTGVSVAACEGQSEFITVQVDPEPVIDPLLDVTICSDDVVGVVLVNDGVSVAAATYNIVAITVDAGLTAGGGNVAAANGVADNYFAADTYTNKTIGSLTATYEVRGVSGAGCVGDSEFIVVTINPEPVVSNSLNTTVCSDDITGVTLATDAASVGALNYNLISITVPAGLTAGGSNATVANGVAADYIENDVFTNLTNGSINVTYEVQAVSAASCVGDSEFIIVSINPEPVIDTALDATICSDVAIGLNFDTDVSSVAAVNYNLIAVNVGAGLTAGGGNVVPANGIGAAYVAGDAYTNITNASIDVTYEVEGVSADGCTGDSKIVTITIDPEPVMDNGLSTTVCSDDAIGVTLAGDGVSVAPVSYNIIDVTIPGALTPNVSNVVFPANGQAANYISGDIYTNVTSSSLDVIYEVRGVSIDGCIGDSEFITVTINPEPVVNPGLSTTVCSDDVVGVTLATNGTSIGAANYDLLSITVDVGLVPGGSNVVASNNVVAGYFTNDTYTNQTAGALNVVYEVRGNSADGCTGDIELINVTVNAEPVVDPGLDNTICSGAGIGLVLNTNGVSIGAANYNIIDVTIDPNLTASGSNVAIPASGVAAAYLSSDSYINTTNTPHDVVYEVRGVSFSACEGDSEFVTITIEPGPVIDPALDTSLCSDVPIGVNFAVDGASVAAASYNLVGITPNPSLTPGGGNVGTANGVGANYIAADTYTNTTSIPLDVIYEVKGVSAAMCVGPSEFITVTIDPEPVIDNGLDKTVCSDEAVGLILVTNGVSVGASTYNVVGITIDPGLVPGGSNAAIPASGVTDSYLSNDSYTNTTGGSLTVVYEARPESGSTCEGDSKFITITVESEPVVNTSLDATVCSDDPVGVNLSVAGGSIAAANYNIVSVTVPGGLTAGGSNVAVPANGVAPGYFSNDTYTNQTNAPINVDYEVTGVSAAGCEGDSEIITVTINPEPVIDPAITATVCSDDVIGINLAVSGTSVAASTYDVVGVTIPAGLTANGGNAGIPGLGVASSYINGDMYTNQTASPISVTYEVKGNSAAGCKGDSEFISVTINPEPVLNPGLDATVCSNEVSGIVFSTNGTSVAAANYNLVSATPAGGLIAGGSNVFPANGVNDTYIQNDTYENTTSGDLTVDYIVEPVSPQGCVGDQLTITLTVHPEPVLDPSLSPAPVCSDVASGVTLAVDAGSIAAVSYNIVGIAFASGLVPGGSNASIGNGQASSAIAGDTYTNTSNVAKQATYDIIPVSADGCAGAIQQVIFTVNPAPELANNLDKIICSGAITSVVFGTTATSAPAANYNVTNVTIPAGLTAGANAAIPANGVTTAYISSDTYANTTNGTLVVEYTVVPVSGAGCEGPADIISVTVEPDFMASANNTKPTICSNDIADITLTTPSTPSAGNVVFNVTASASSGTVSGFSPSLSFLPDGYIIADNLINVGNTSETVTYTITPVAPGAAGGLSCTGSSIVEVVTVDPLPIITPGQSELICSNEALNYTITTSNGLVGTTFTWPAPTLPAGVTGGSARAVASSAPIGDTFINSTASRQVVVYEVTPFGPSALNCMGNTVNVQVYVDPLPDGTISVDQPVVCYGGSALLSFAMTVGTAPFEIVYNDGTSDIIVSNIANSHFISLNNLTTTTTYTFKSIKDVNGCEQSLIGQDVTVTVEHPVADFSMDVDEDCTPLEVTFTNNDIQAGTVYDWNFGDGSPITTTSDATVTHTYVNNSTSSDISFSPILTATRTNGSVVCTNSMMDNVTINAGVSLNVTPSDTEGCSPLTVNFENNSQGVLSGRWYWRAQGTTDENDIQTSPNASYTLSNTTTSNIIYEVVYEGERNGCGDKVVTEVTVYPEVIADFTVAPGTTVSITDPTITVTNTTLNSSAWITQWEWGDGQSTTNVDPGSHTYASFGDYELKLTILDPNGVCESVKTEIITVEPTIPVVDFEANIFDGCMPLTVQFTNLSTSVDPDTYVWTFVDDTGATVATSSVENPEITFFEPGVINVTLEGSNPLGVTDTETKLGYIEIYEIPTASFSVRPETVFLPDQIMFTNNLSSLADAFEWDFDGDGIPDSEEFEPQFQYTEPGVYDVSMIAINTATGCSDTVVVEKAVTVVESGTSDVPNGFFPGTGDGSSNRPEPGSPQGINSVFLPNIKGVRDDGFKMQVFDRWGHLLFESEDKNVGWNGRHFNTGKLMAAGVYVYKLELVYVSGQQTTVVGDVNLIR